MTLATRAVIVGAEVAAGHDGDAELVIRVRHENGVTAPVVLDGEAGLRLMGGRGADDLIGRAWRDVLAETLLARDTCAQDICGGSKDV